MKRLDKVYHDEQPVDIAFTASSLLVTLANGQVLETPLALHSWLEQATPEARLNAELGPWTIYWPDIDEGIDVDWLLETQPHRAEHKL